MRRLLAPLLTLLALGAAFPCVAEEGGTRKWVYICDTGSAQVNSIEPCAPGKLVGSQEVIVYPSGIIRPIPKKQYARPATQSEARSANDPSRPDIRKLEYPPVPGAVPGTKEPVLKNGQK